MASYTNNAYTNNMNNYNSSYQKRKRPQKHSGYRRNIKNNAQHSRYQIGKYDKLKEKIFTDNTPPRRVTNPFPVHNTHETAKVIDAFTASTPPKNKAQPRKKSLATIDFNPDDYNRRAAQFAPYPQGNKPFISNYKHYPSARQKRYQSSPYTKPRGPPPPGFSTHNAPRVVPRPNVNNIGFYESVPRAPEPTQLQRQRAPIQSYRAQIAPTYSWKQKTQSQKQLETQQKFDELTKNMHSEDAKAEVLLKLTIEELVRRKEEKKERQLQQERERRNQLKLEERRRKLQQLLSEQQMTQSAVAQIVQSLDFHTMQYKQAEITGNATSMKVLLIQIQQDKQLHKQGVDKLNTIMQQIALIEQGHDDNEVHQNVHDNDDEYVQNEVQHHVNINKNAPRSPKLRLPHMQPKPRNNKQSVAEWKINMDYGKSPRYY